MGTLSVEMSSLGRTGEGERTLQYQDTSSQNLKSKTQKINTNLIRNHYPCKIYKKLKQSTGKN